MIIMIGAAESARTPPGQPKERRQKVRGSMGLPNGGYVHVRAVPEVTFPGGHPGSGGQHDRSENRYKPVL